MKNMKKILALVISTLLVLTSLSVAFAAEGVPADTSISVTGLETGDTVNFYQVLKYDETATDTRGWVAAPGFTGLTKAQIQTILGLDSTGKPVTITNENRADYGISAALAATITGMAQTYGKDNAKFKNVGVTSGTANQATTNIGDAGLYLALITPGTVDYLYNPVFVGADYTAGNSNSQEAVITPSYADEALAKKENITLTKEIDGDADTKYDVNVGDIIPFTITSKVPAFSTAYQEPVYELTDVMETGLALAKFDETEGTAAATDIHVAIEGVTLADGDYTTSLTTDGFKVVVNAAGLAKVTALGVAKTITVTYKAKITTLENANVTEKDNEATVKFSNNPEDKNSYSLLEDKTRNYTFSIDASLLGNGEWENSELVKVGLNPDGTEITQEKLSNGTYAGVLQGAAFELYTDAEGKTLYTNPTFDGHITSDEHGKLKITGLDEGTYYLKETSAPTGYIKDNRTFKIVISATYDTIEGGTYVNDDQITVKYDSYKVLKDYTVAVYDNADTSTPLGSSTFNITNSGEKQEKTATAASETDQSTKISNTKGTELPSTGGMGTTLLYVGGSILVILAAILLITKRRMNAED